MPLPKLKTLVSELHLRFCAIDLQISFLALEITSKKIQNSQLNLLKVVPIWRSQWNLGFSFLSIVARMTGRVDVPFWIVALWVPISVSGHTGTYVQRESMCSIYCCLLILASTNSTGTTGTDVISKCMLK